MSVFSLQRLGSHLLPVLVVSEGAVQIRMDYLGLKDTQEVSMQLASQRTWRKLYGDSPGETHVDLVAVEKVNVGLVLVFVLTHQQQHGGVTRLIRDCLAQVDDGEGEVLQLLLQEQQSEAVSG